jgi:hypothetical protein
MVMGTRKQRQRQEELWRRRDLAEAPGHPSYRRGNPLIKGTFWLHDVQLAAVATAKSNH